MRVLFVNDYGALAGGAEISLAAMQAGLRSRGHTVRWFSTTAHGRAGPLVSDAAGRGTTSAGRALLQTANPWAAAALRRELAVFRPDVVHVKVFLTQFSPLILPVLRGWPSLYHAVWYRAVCPVGTRRLPSGAECAHPWGRACLRAGCLPLRDWLPLEAQRGLLRRWRGVFGAVVANSESTRCRLAAGGWPVTAVIPNGTPCRPARPPLSHPPLVAFAGRLVPEKGAAVLLRAFAQARADLPEARLLIAGEGPERRALEALTAQLGLAAAVTFTGYLPPEELERRLAPAWVQAVPSQWAEPFGLVAIEAMLRGTAVLAGRAGGLAEIVRDGQTGRLLPPDDEAAWAAALLDVLQAPGRAEQWGAAGRAVALAEYTLDRQLDALLAVYQSLGAA
ncbi:MAG: glycosyltransferase family 4 protein [Anaerolineales bacterium]|nr:glycosyltransferase family 4 protein [Anaerolineales bacterium]